MMVRIPTALEGVVILEPKVFGDERGYFLESWSQREFDSLVGPVRFVQDNESKSRYGVVRGLHYQKPPFTQSTLVRCVLGVVLDLQKNREKNAAGEIQGADSRVKIMVIPTNEELGIARRTYEYVRK